MKRELQKNIFEIIKTKWPKADIWLEMIEISYPPEGFGDYASNIAMKMAKGLKMNPEEIAENIKEDLEKHEMFEKIEVAKPGFLNINLTKEYFQQLVSEINKAENEFGNSKIGKGKKIQVEFVSANPTGPIHLGNGRGGPLGDTLANVLSKAGYDAQKEYYVNDYGNQVKILGHSVLNDDEAQYKGDYIDQLHEELGGGDPFEVGQKAAKKIMDEIIKPTMEKANIKFDNYFSEKSLHDGGEVEKALRELEDKGLVFDKDGAKWFRATKYGDDKDRVVKKSTGETTYFGTDIAYHKNKFQRGFEKVYNIWGADHHGDVARLMGAVDALGYKGKLEIILSQFVRVIKDGKEFKMSKRKGTYVSLDDLLEEAGKDAVRFFFLMHSPDTHMDFDLDLAKQRSDKNPVYYVQYAHARICSILRKSGQKYQNAKLELLVHPKELELIRHLNRFPELIEEIAASHEVHRLPYYSTTLADKFHSFYHECKVLDPDKQELSAARLELVKSSKTVLAETLRLMGVDAPEKM